MDSIAIKIIRPVLMFLARLTIARYRPRVIGVTGSVGKTSTKRAVAAVFAKNKRVRMAEGNLNNEMGLSLAILGAWSADELTLISRDQPAGTAKFRKLMFWLKVSLVGAWRLVVKSKNYPEVLVLEYGADRPGDILRLMKVARPAVAIVTAIGDVPVHVEFYSGPEAVAREKGRLIERLAPWEFAVLNHDDDFVRDLAERTRGHVMTYGFDAGADLRVVRLQNRVSGGIPAGIAFSFEYEGSSVPVRIDGVFGKAPAYAAAAAACVGLISGLNLVTASEALADYAPAPSRMELLPGIKRTLVIDDSYNASPLSMYAAIDTLKGLPASRKIAVLGDMLEIGKYTIEAHEEIGRRVADAADILITVGPRAKFIADSAHAAGMTKSHIYSFDTAAEVIQPLTHLMKQGDLVIVKGSHAMGLDVVVHAVTAEPVATGEA
ncbi:MAG: Mur ligase family protein [Minisyncoccia bacterium]|jgi:UDP-N-acetylmuramoyl-tripeptide--D-alanyl-D-alanine ligase